MQKHNMNEIMATGGMPSMNYLIKKEFSEFKNLQKTILLKEIEFKNCNKWENEYALQSVQLEKDLGELYEQLVKTVVTLKIDLNENTFSK